MENINGSFINHEDLVNMTKKTLNDIIKNNSNLKYLPIDVTLDEINAQISAQHGESMTVNVVRGDNEEISVIVKHRGSRVIDLKRAFQHTMSLKLQREGEYAKISWRRIWRTHWLSFDGTKLTSDKELLSEYGIVNKSKVTFVKKLKFRDAMDND